MSDWPDTPLTEWIEGPLPPLVRDVLLDADGNEIELKAVSTYFSVTRDLWD